MTDPLPPRPPLPNPAPQYPGQQYPSRPNPAPQYPGQQYPGQAPTPYPGQAQTPYPGQAPFAAPSGRPVSAPVPPPPAARRSSILGAVALVAGIVALALPTILASVAGLRIGLGAGRRLVVQALFADFDWSIFTPVRGWVLVAELSFWVGTALGLWALIQGIVAIVARRGRGAGIAATVIAVFAPIVFFVALSIFLALGLGLAAGASTGS